MIAMEPRVYRFRSGRIAAEAVAAVGVGLILGAGVESLLEFEGVRAPLALPGLGLAGVFLAVLFWARWRRRFAVDDRGVERRRGSRPVARMEWDEVEELFLLGWPGFELHGAGRTIRVHGPYEGLHHARSQVVPHLTGIREHLRSRALRDGQAVFRMPGGAWRPHLAYLGALMILTAVTGLCLAPLLKGRFFPIIVVFCGSWLWGLRRRASQLGTRVLVRPDGFEVRRLDRRDLVRWEDFDRAEWNEQDGLDLVLRSRRVIKLPPSLGNIGLLEELLREGPPAVDSGTTEGAENRTMMQSS
jgi:hypothetical protein